MNTISLPRGTTVPALGLGTWRLGESARSKPEEVKALRLAFELGYRLIDTAEMYGEGGAEEVVGEALAGAISAGTVTRDEVFIVSKVYPHNASRSGVIAACERSLARLRIDHIDLYLLHWRGAYPLRDTLAGFEVLQASGRIRDWGVSNFDTDDMKELWSLPGGEACTSNQVYYALAERGPAFDLLPWQREKRVPLMAYSPIAQGALATDTTLHRIGERHGVSASQIALAWVLGQDDVIAIPKAVRELHLRDNLAAAAVVLSADDHADIDRRFPPPKRKTALGMI